MGLLQGLIKVTIVAFSEKPPVCMNPVERNLLQPKSNGAAAVPGTYTSNIIGLRESGQGKKKSLLIGINYFGQAGQLSGCINDVNNVKKLIKSRGFSESTTHMRVLTDDNRNPANQPTRRNILEGMLFNPLLTIGKIYS